MDEKILGTENINKLFLKYTVPAVIAMVIGGSQTLIGGMILGKYVGANALAAVNIVNPFVQFAMAVSLIIAFGALSIIGRSLGAGQYERAQNTFKTALIIIVIFAATYGLIGFAKATTVSRWLGADVVLLDSVRTYLRIFSLFIMFHPLMILTGFADRIVGKPQLYLQATLTMLAVNTSLSLFLIKYLGLGIQGAALASGCAFFSGFLVSVRPMFKKRYAINVFAGHFDKSTMVPMLYNGASEGIGAASTALAIYLFNLEFMRRIGPSGVAAFTTIGFVVQFGVNMIFGIADGVSPIISYNFGHEKFSRVKGIMHKATASGLVIGVLISGVLFFGGGRLAGMFADQGDVIAMAASGGKVYAFAFLVNSFNIIHSVYFTAIGGAKESALIAFSRGMLWIVIGINIWPHTFGITGVWLTIPVAEVMTVLLVAILVKMRPVEKVSGAVSEFAN
ncbi:MAG: MATE family efflux transporter [Clostridia bacterium]|nr:MATE family efflux transporter [Clostridia bacterium]